MNDGKLVNALVFGVRDLSTMSLCTCHYAALQACCGTLPAPVHAAPWLTKLAYAVIQGKLEERQDQLAREAVNNMEKLGPTFIKLGQILSIR